MNAHALCMMLCGYICHPQLTHSRVFLRNFYYYSIGYVNYYSYICLLIDWYCKGNPDWYYLQMFCLYNNPDWYYLTFD